MDKTLSSAITPGQSGAGSDGNKGVLRIPKISSITGTSPSYCLVSYPEHSLGGGLPLCRDAVSVFYSPKNKEIKREKRARKERRKERKRRKKEREKRKKKKERKRIEGQKSEGKESRNKRAYHTLIIK